MTALFSRARKSPALWPGLFFASTRGVGLGAWVGCTLAGLVETTEELQHGPLIDGRELFDLSEPLEKPRRLRGRLVGGKLEPEQLVRRDLQCPRQVGQERPRGLGPIRFVVGHDPLGHVDQLPELGLRQPALPPHLGQPGPETGNRPLFHLVRARLKYLAAIHHNDAQASRPRNSRLGSKRLSYDARR